MPKALQPHQLRVIDEREALAGNREKLRAFIKSPAFINVDPDERERLALQAEVQKLLLDVLDLRIKAFKT